MRPSSAIIAYAVDAVSAATPLFAQRATTTDQFAVARAHAKAAVVDSGVPSLAVAVSKGGKIIWAGRIQTTNPESPQDVSKELAKIVLPKLKKAGIL